ncbi:MAG: protein-tyrosine-phosphatase [Crocinitomicaceae bacterium]|nr:protein-tyrosine-phosphatase [Crocinitomicaceae bacterium]MBK8926169.1 protein-tyrosine-phosphatase [Crocinitomicaceae bacterium]
MMYPPLINLIKSLENSFDQIPDERKNSLQKLAAFISEKLVKNEIPSIMYICIHNSRRSHFGQIAGLVAASYYHIKVQTFSGGTVATAFHENAIQALQDFEFKIEKINKQENAEYAVYLGEQIKTICFSKTFDHPLNPASGFAAVMTCSEAETDCPFIPSAEIKIATPYDDPKISDGSGTEKVVYQDRFKEILRDNLYVFSLIKK